jgi:hypothetical protein
MDATEPYDRNLTPYITSRTGMRQQPMDQNGRFEFYAAWWAPGPAITMQRPTPHHPTNPISSTQSKSYGVRTFFHLSHAPASLSLSHLLRCLPQRSAIHPTTRCKNPHRTHPKHLSNQCTWNERVSISPVITPQNPWFGRMQVTMTTTILGL